MLSITLPSMLSSIVPNPLDVTLAAYLTVRSHVGCQDTPKNCSKYAPMHTSENVPKYTSESFSSTLAIGKTLPISLDYILPYMLLHARSRDLLRCRRQALGGVRQVAGDWWRAAYGGQNHDVSRYYSLNHIFSAATVTRSHDASRSWC
jgi:hypothetical protein